MNPVNHCFSFIVLLAAFAFCCSPANAQAGFDCKKASTETEKAICSDPEIAESDRGMTVSYKSLLDRTGTKLREALRADQAAFLKIRTEAFESSLANRDMRMQKLRDYTDMRAEFLNWIAVTDQLSLEGTWSNAQGSVVLKRKASGGLAVKIDVADQANGSWVCSFEGDLEQGYTDEAKLQSAGGPLVLRLDGATLKIPTPFCDGSTSGGFGSAAGTYFHVGASPS